MIKQLRLLALLTAFAGAIFHLFAMGGDGYLAREKTRLFDGLKKVETEDRDAWKLVFLERLLSESEQIEALDRAIQEDMLVDPVLGRKLREARELSNKGEQLATLSYLLPSLKKKIRAYTKKVSEKIYDLGYEYESTSSLDAA